MTNPDDNHSVSQLLRLLEGRLDKHVDDIRYVSITTQHGREGGN